MKKMAVEFKGTKGGLTIYCLEGVGFSELLADLEQRLRQRAAFFGEAEVRVNVGGRELTEEQKERLVTVIRENSRLKPAGIVMQPDGSAALPPARRRGDFESLQLEGLKEGRSLVIKRTLRSGQGIHFPGHVVVLGDVNPGAEIIAEGDIFVFGTIRGIAHAGARGDRKASVVALRLSPTQLRIADVISRAPDENPPLPDQAEYAYIADDRILIAAITTKAAAASVRKEGV
ncbi:MAG: Septum site-determining protein MinC [Syntrophomonadaceae bacterium]|nr:Septum site-determining protein MinC [Bacillota bacterium]